MCLPVRCRVGMTLIELLVTIAIIGVIAIVALPNVVNSAESRRSREAARTVSTFVAKAQSRAVGRNEWSGFTLTPSGSTSWAAMDLFMAEVPGVYRGDTFDASLSVGGSGSGRTGTSSPSALQTLATQSIVLPNDLIRFGGRGPYYEITSATTSGITFRQRTYNASSTVENSGQTEHNTPWPPSGVRLPFEVHRQPVRSSPTTLADGRVIDLRWSGCGPRASGATSAVYRRFVRSTLTGLNYDPVTTAADVAGQAVTVLFDATGRLRQILIGTDRFAVTGTIFLLVGRADRAGQGYAVLDPADASTGANWQYGDSFWVAIDAMTGVAKVAECVPDAGTNLTDQQAYDKLIDSQAFVRAAFD